MDEPREHRSQIALVGAYDTGATTDAAAGAGTNVSVCRYFYGEGADSLATRGQSSWHDWLIKTFGIGQSTAAP